MAKTKPYTFNYDRSVPELLERFRASQRGGKARRPDYICTSISAAEASRLADFIDAQLALVAAAAAAAAGKR